MKKVRLNLRRGVKGWSFVLYDSAESAFYLKDEPFYGDDVDDYRKVVSLMPGETIEAEWVGSEWIYADDSDPTRAVPSTQLQQKFDKVRLAKMVPIKGTPQKTGILELYIGWVRGGDVDWAPSETQSKVRITPIKGKIRSKVDLSRLFVKHLDGDDVLEEESEASNAQVEPTVLN